MDSNITVTKPIRILLAEQAEFEVWHPPLVEEWWETQGNGIDAKIGTLHYYWREYARYFKT